MLKKKKSPISYVQETARYTGQSLAAKYRLRLIFTVNNTIIQAFKNLIFKHKSFIS